MALLLALLLLVSCLGPWQAAAEDSLDAAAVSTGSEHVAPELLVLRIAQEEIGYQEGPAKDESKYGAYFGKPRAAWCTEFITWCVVQAEERYGLSLIGSLYPNVTTAKKAVEYYVMEGRFVSDTGKTILGQRQWLLEERAYLENNAFIPKPGDLVWFCYYVRGTADHTAIVEEVITGEDGEQLLVVIEGNNPDRVQRNTYALTDRSIYGYGTPDQRVMTELRIHHQGKDVLVLRGMLERLGYLSSKERETSVFTDAVRSAMLRFQKDAGLQRSGRCDMASWLALADAVARAD